MNQDDENTPCQPVEGSGESTGRKKPYQRPQLRALGAVHLMTRGNSGTVVDTSMPTKNMP